MPQKKASAQSPATKADLEALRAALITKTEFKKEIGRIDTTLQNQTKENGRIDNALQNQAKAILELQKSNEKILETILQTKTEILSAVDAFAKDTKEMERDVVLQGGHLADHDKQFKDHESRLKKLETAST